MGNVRYSDETVKYKLIANISIDGIANEPDIVGALFGQTEGLLERDMELKHLQRTGRIGRIDLEINNKSGNTSGRIVIPSSLNKIETAIIAATIESVDRVGACSCNIELERIVDVRKDKRNRIATRAAEIMKKWDIEEQSDSVDISAIVEEDAKRGKIIQFGYEKLAAGPGIYKSDEVILVEGRADVSTLLKVGIDNTIAVGGTNVSDTIVNLCKNRTVTALLDGDRGGDMILKELLLVADIDYVARAPYKKEIEYLSLNQIKSALKDKVEITEAEFVSEDFSVVSFLQKNKRFSFLDRKTNGKDKEKTSTKSKRKKSTKPSKNKRSKSETKSKTKKKYRKKSKRSKKSKRRSKKSRRRSKPKIQVNQEVQSIINETKQTMNAVFVDATSEKLLTVSTDQVFDKLKSMDNQIDTIIVDGVITQRLLDLADQKSIKLVAGAVVGEIEKEPKKTKYTTFRRLR